MEITIKGELKEIADLITVLQAPPWWDEQLENRVIEVYSNVVMGRGE
jgi:hypothetical protein